MQRSVIVFLLVTAQLAAESLPVETPAGAGSLAPGLTALPGGDVALTWLEPAGDGHAVRFAVYHDGSFGSARTIAQGADWFANWADTPALYSSPDGTWYAHWLVKSGPAVYAYDIRLVRSADRGRSWSPPLTPHHDCTQTEHGFVSYFTWPDGRAGIAWLDGRETVGQSHEHSATGELAGVMTLRAATIGAQGDADTGWLLDASVCDCCPTDSAMTSEGPVVVYRDRDENEIRDISIVRWNGDGWSEPRPVHRDGWRIGGCPVNGPAVLANGDDVIVAWFTMPDNVPVIRIALSNDGGRSFAPPNELAVGSALGRVDLAWMGGKPALLWMEEHGGKASLRLARFDEELDRKHGVRNLVEVDAGRASGKPRIAALDANTALISWTARVNSQTRVEVARVQLDP